MKVAVSAATAKSSAATIKRASAIARPTIPILAGAHVAAARGTLTIRVTDLDVHAAVTLDAEVRSEGEAVVPAAMLAGVFARSSGDITVTSGSHDITISAGAFRSRFRGMAANEFPDPLGVRSEAARFTMSGEDVAAMGRLAEVTDQKRHHLCGVLLRAAGGRLALIAGDDHRRLRIGCDTAYAGPDIIVPAATARLIASLIPDGGDFTSDGKVLEVAGGAVRIASKLVDATFPDHAMPPPSGSALTVDAGRLAQALTCLGIVASKFNRGAVLTWDHEAPGELRVTLGQSHLGAGVIVLQAEAVGDGHVGVDLDHATELLKAVQAGTVRLDHAGGTAPILITVPDRPHTVAALAPLYVRTAPATDLPPLHTMEEAA